MKTNNFSFSKKCVAFLMGLALLLSVAITPMAASPVGDLNGDNAVSSLDLSTLAVVILTDVKEIEYDVNGDGIVDIRDLIRLKKKLAYVTVKASAEVSPVDSKVPAGGVTLATSEVSAFVPEGVLLEDGVDTLVLTVTPLIFASDDISVSDSENITSYDVHIEGVSKNNTVPIIIDLGAVMPKFLNMGNYSIYHVENGENKLMTLVDSKADLTAHNQFTYDPLTGAVTVAMASFSEVALLADTENAWNGTVAESFSKGEGTVTNPYIIANADQLAYLNECVSVDNDDYGDKHYKLISDINFGGLDSKNVWYPIGYWKNGEGTNKANEAWYTYGGAFSGSFDGNGHTISGIYQNTWIMDGDYDNGYWNDAMGLFGYVSGGTVKNLTVDSFVSEGEFTPTGVIAAYAADSTFENISITNCNPGVYNTGNGGIVGIGGISEDTADKKLTFTNITVDNSNKISALWGSWDVACGGIMGMFRGNGLVEFNNCHVAAQIDVYNDVCGNYQYYWYRYAGMMIGSIRKNTVDENGYTVPDTTGITATACTVHFGDWNDYYYCELVANSLASYTHDHQFSRLEQIDSINEIKSGETWTKAGNFLLIEGETKTCYHIVNKNGTLEQHLHTASGTETVNGETVDKEDKKIVYLPFNQLFQGDGWGVKHIPIYDDGSSYFEGITILDHDAKSVEKFAKADETTEFTSGEVKISELFKAVSEPGIAIKDSQVEVFVSPVDDSTVSGTYTADSENWENGTLTFTGSGKALISITDYYYCKTTTIEVTIG